MPRSTTGVKRKPVDKDNIDKAVEMVMTKSMSTYSAAKHFNISRTTLQRQVKQFVQSGKPTFSYRPNNNVKQVFSEQEERLLLEYIKKAGQSYFGVTLHEIRQLAYQFAKAYQIKFDESWERNQMAGGFWLRSFRKKYASELYLRRSEAGAITRFNCATLVPNSPDSGDMINCCQQLTSSSNLNSASIDQQSASTSTPSNIVAPEEIRPFLNFLPRTSLDVLTDAPEELSSEYEPDLEYEESFSENEDITIPGDKLLVGDYVVTKMEGKKSVKYFVAEIVRIVDDSVEEAVNDANFPHLKTVLNSQQFHIDKESIYELANEDVMFKLPNLTTGLSSSSSNEQQKHLSFGGDFWKLQS